MFDIGFWELAIIGVVALLVIGPERLPSVAKSVGTWVGKAKQFVSYVQSDIKTEINKADELKQLLQQQTQIKEVHEIIEQTVTDTKEGVSVGAKLAQHAVKSFAESEGTNDAEALAANTTSDPVDTISNNVAPSDKGMSPHSGQNAKHAPRSKPQVNKVTKSLNE
ncbi:MAG: Sec-independent protein translocase protein TatB [Thiohalomonadales bacterium]